MLPRSGCSRLARQHRLVDGGDLVGHGPPTDPASEVVSNSGWASEQSPDRLEAAGLVTWAVGRGATIEPVGFGPIGGFQFS
jgi:hypothetical protein